MSDCIRSQDKCVGLPAMLSLYLSEVMRPEEQKKIKLANKLARQTNPVYTNSYTIKNSETPFFIEIFIDST